MLRSAREIQDTAALQWDLPIHVALVTGMRKSELLNLVWGDIGFDAGLVEVQPKKNTNETWEWCVKDTDHRTLESTEHVLSLPADLQTQRPEGHPYVLVPPARYGQIQRLRREGEWTYADSQLKVIHNFDDQFKRILAHASIPSGRFHDLRSTALTNWLAMGLREYEVMRLAMRDLKQPRGFTWRSR